MTTKEEDEIFKIMSVNTHDNLYFFTDRGKVFSLKAYDLPEGSRQSRGQAIINLININQGEKIQAVLNLAKDAAKKYLFMATKKGQVKKTEIKKFTNIRANGLIAIRLKNDDRLIKVVPTTGDNHIMLISHEGKAIRFSEKDVRPMGREAQGVKGINLKPGDEVVSMDLIPEKLPQPKDRRRKVFRHLLVVMENGIGKRTDVYQYPLQKRGGVGVKVANLTEKTGKVACAQVIDETAGQLVLTSRQAQIIKLPVKNIPLLGRTTQGVILMRFKKSSSDSVAALTCLRKNQK